eukprot:6189882-Pleurochrysis_carterae.AAC.1
MGHGQAFTAVYDDGGICGMSPANRMYPIGSSGLRGSGCHKCKTIVYMWLRAILGCILVLEVIVSSATPGGTCSCSILVCGRTMMYKWGHPVATLPSDGGDYTSLSQNDVISANHGAPVGVRSSQRRRTPVVQPSVELSDDNEKKVRAFGRTKNACNNARAAQQPQQQPKAPAPTPAHPTSDADTNT